MQFLMNKRHELDTRPELLTVIRLLKQEREAAQGKVSPPQGPMDEDSGQLWRKLPELLEPIGTFLEYNPAAFKKACGFFSEEVLLCAESSLLWLESPNLHAPLAAGISHGLRQIREYRNNKCRCMPAPGSMALQTVRISSKVSLGSFTGAASCAWERRQRKIQLDGNATAAHA
jgi:hypothetical protein